jgi:hypothetical protein
MWRAVSAQAPHYEHLNMLLRVALPALHIHFWDQVRGKTPDRSPEKQTLCTSDIILRLVSCHV